MTMSDAVRSIDPEALLAHAGWVRALARRLAADADDGDDVAQQALVAAMARPPREGVALGPWLAGVVRHLAWKARRSATRRARHEGGAPPRPAPAGPDEIAARAETFRAVVDAVLAVDPLYRDVVVLRFFDGLATHAVASRLGVPVETARTRLKRALALLRARLDRDHGSRAAWMALLAPSDPGRVRPGLEVGIAAGGALVGKKLVAAAVLALLLLGGAAWSVLTPPPGAPTTAEAAPSSDDVVAPRPAPAEERSPDGRARRAGRASSGMPTGAVPGGTSPDPAPAAPLDPSDALTVRVVDDTGAPVAGIPIGLTHANRLDWGPTDADGVWRTRRPEVEAAVYANVEKDVGGRWFLDARTTVAPGAVDARLTLTEVSLVTGRVVDPDGNPLPLLEMEVLVDGARVFKTNTEAEGVFVARVPLRGRAELALTGLAYSRSDGSKGDAQPHLKDAGADVSRRRIVGAAVARMQFALDSPWDGRLTDLRPGASDLVLVAQRVPQDAELVVRIVDPAGAALPGVCAEALRPGGLVTLFRDGATPAPLTDAEGRIRLSGLDRRELRVRAWIPSRPVRVREWLREPDECLLECLEPLPLDVVARGQEVTLAFRAANPVAGTVVLDGAAVRDAQVQVFAQDAPAGGPALGASGTDAAGAFRVLLPLDAPRALRVEVTRKARRVRVEGVAPGTVGLRIELNE
jgi:RNA polymerase sigma factor (sigma-70 family)